MLESLKGSLMGFVHEILNMYFLKLPKVIYIKKGLQQLL